ncbi:MAG: class II aldolase/adducin family protein [Fastidiosipilaceae bacterium]|jgi:L-fuculose-phosphate aldolase
MEKRKQKLIEIGRRMVDRNLTSGTGGNISFYDQSNDVVWITPTGYDFYSIELVDLVGIDLTGKIIAGELKPTSEWHMHVEVYKYRQDVKAVIHGHTVYATALSLLREPLTATHYMVALAGKNVPIAEYATFGTLELAVNAVKAMGMKNAVLLANHGVNAVGSSLEHAFAVLEQVEYCSRLQLIARSAGQPIVIEDAEMNRIIEKFKSYGQ